MASGPLSQGHLHCKHQDENNPRLSEYYQQQLTSPQGRKHGPTKKEERKRKEKRCPNAPKAHHLAAWEAKPFNQLPIDQNKSLETPSWVGIRTRVPKLVAMAH
jgi:hypothetical protein